MGQIDQYARQALSDPQFMAKHQDLIIQRPDMLGTGSYKFKLNQDIAAAYLKEIVYDKQFESTPTIPSTASAPFVNWGANRWQPNMNIPNLEETEVEEETVEIPEEDDEFPTPGKINF